MIVQARPGQKSLIRKALATCRFAIVSAGVISMVMNLLVLTGPFYMLQIYDRVLPGHSIPTLLAFSALALILFITYGALDLARTRLMARLGAVLDIKLADAAFTQQMQIPGQKPASGEALRDLGTVRQFLSGPAAIGLLDVPWLPLYMGIIFMLHPVIGWVSIAGAGVFLVIASLNESLSRRKACVAEESKRRDDQLAADARANADTVRGMGMMADLRRHWNSFHVDAIETAQRAADLNASFAVLSRTLRLILQSAILGIGAYLTIQNELSSGALIACSIIFARALAPVDQAVAHWRGILQGRLAWQRLVLSAVDNPQDDNRLELRAPSRSLAVTNLGIASPDRKKLLLPNVAFQLEAGDCLAVIGASGAGKSSLIRTLVGSALPISGEIRVDGATLDQWTSTARSKHIGYLSQDVQLLDGTIGQNISRFQAAASADAIISAAELAGVHDLVVSLSNGYDTVVGPHGVMLSAGQKQRIGLARAVFGTPFLIILDEPNAHLDRDGELALANALQRLRSEGSIVVVAAHRASILSVVNKMLLLEDGRPALFGTKEEIMAHMTKSTRTQQERNLHVVSA